MQLVNCHWLFILFNNASWENCTCLDPKIRILRTSHSSSIIRILCFSIACLSLTTKNRNRLQIFKHLLWNWIEVALQCLISSYKKGPGYYVGQLTCPPPAHPAAPSHASVPRSSTNSTENHSYPRLSVYWVEQSQRTVRAWHITSVNFIQFLCGARLLTDDNLTIPFNPITDIIIIWYIYHNSFLEFLFLFSLHEAII